MKATYADFIYENPNCSKYENNTDAQEVFDLISEDANIIEMIAMCDMCKPALTACASKIEELVENKQLSQIAVSDGFNRTVIGRMIKTILAPFGYLPTKQNYLSKNIGAIYFTSGMCYEKRGNATMQIVKEIREIPNASNTTVENNLSQQFEVELIENAEIAKRKHKYNANYYLQMIKKHGGVTAAKILIGKSKASAPSDGFIKLLMLGEKELTMEASVAKDKYAPLFTAEEIDYCKALLASK